VETTDLSSRGTLGLYLWRMSGWISIEREEGEGEREEGGREKTESDWIIIACIYLTYKFTQMHTHKTHKLTHNTQG